jgi:hypothetical protein
MMVMRKPFDPMVDLTKYYCNEKLLRGVTFVKINQG